MKSKSDIERIAKESIIDVLGLDSNRHLDVNQPLSEIGIDSLLAVELEKYIRRGYWKSSSSNNSI